MSITKVLGGALALALSTAAPAATFSFDFKLTRDSETFIGSGKLFGDDGTAANGVTTYALTGATGSLVYTLPDDIHDYGYTRAVAGLAGFAPSTVARSADGTLTARFLLQFDDQPYFMELVSGSPTAFVTESNYTLESLVIGDAGAVPEPAAWALMIAGFGLAGTALRARRTTMSVA